MSDPMTRFLAWYREARAAGIPEPEACALATVGPGGRPSLRFVLIKRVGRSGFVFFTDTRSRKGREIAAHPIVALTFYWEELGRQVRIEGRASEISDRESDAYWRTRPRESRLSASASRQSRPLRSRAELLRRVRLLRRRFLGRPIPRPGRWKGIRVVPRSVEFWTARPYRLHWRERFVRTRSGWRGALLEP